ncbi:hypothetical protein BMT54_10525 [Pasteurellaceae bacterium 15-036681]|nr:hypothetical protein BMT54_10525 [Pasteurellaceae bacterium 15-036681]
MIFSVNKIRNKAVAHIDDFDINNIYRQFKVSKQHLDNIIFYIDKRLECLIRHSELNFTKNELIYLEGEGIHAILNLLPEKNPYAKSAKGIRLERQFDYICEIT